MKKLIIYLAISSLLTFNNVAGADDIVGRWLTADKNAYVDIEVSDGVYTGTIVGVPAEMNSDQPNADLNNPDESLRSRPLVGLTILSSLTRAKANLWKGGTIYDPNKGESYDCKIWLEGGSLKLRGYKGMLYRTSKWTPVPSTNR